MIASRLRHEAVVYTDDDAYAASVVPFVRDGLEAGGAVMCAVPVERIWLLRDALGRRADVVEWADAADVGRNPALLVAALRRFLARHPDKPCRGVGEPVWPGRDAVEVAECQLHEHLVNRAFAGEDRLSLLCPYAASLGATVVDEARRSHPVVDGGPSAAYVEPDVWARPFPPVVEAAVAFPFAADDLVALRAFVRHHAARHGLPDERAADLVLAANELATNSIRHARGTGTLRIWSEGWSVVCEVRDAGRVTDPLAGRELPLHPDAGGRGLWLANHLCELVQLWSGPQGTVVRLRVG